MRFIADASVSLCWFLPDQVTEESNDLLPTAQRSGTTVPLHWRLEVLNKIGLQARSGKLSSEAVNQDPVILASLDTEVRPLPSNAYEILALTSRHNLTAYDAAYLHLAMATRLPLATYDKELIVAAPAEGVVLLH